MSSKNTKSGAVTVYVASAQQPKQTKNSRKRNKRKNGSGRPSAPAAEGLGDGEQAGTAAAGKAKDSIVMPFRELIELGVPSGTNSSQVVYNVPVDFTVLNGTRIGIEANLWEYYRFRKLCFKVISSVPTDEGGSYLMSYDADPSDARPPNSASGMRQLCAQSSSKIASYWQTSEMECPTSGATKLLFTNPGLNPNGGSSDPRLCQQGQFTLATLSPTKTGTSSVMVQMSGVCEFKTKNLSPPPGPQEIYNANGGLSVPASNTGTSSNLLQSLADGVAGVAKVGQSLVTIQQDANGRWGFYLGRGSHRVSFAALLAASATAVGSPTLGLFGYAPPGKSQPVISQDAGAMNFNSIGAPGAPTTAYPTSGAWNVTVPALEGAFMYLLSAALGGSSNAIVSSKPTLYINRAPVFA